MTVSNRSHNASDREAIEIVIDKDQHTKDDCRDLRTNFRLNMLARPIAECRRTARLIHQADHNTENNKENQNADIILVRQRTDQTILKNVIDRCFKIKIHTAADLVDTVQNTTDHNTDEQRTVNFLRPKREDNRNNRRNQRPECLKQHRRVLKNFCSIHKPFLQFFI